MAVQQLASAAREQQAVDDLFVRLESGFRLGDVSAGLLEPMASFIGAESAAIRLTTGSDPDAIPSPLALLDIPAAVGDAYLGRYCDLDPARRLPQRGNAGPVFADPDRPGEWLNVEAPDVGPDFRARFREYRRNFLLPFNLVHHAGFYLEVAEEQTLLFDFHRGRRGRPFGRLETSRMHVAARYLYGRVAARWNPAPAAFPPGTPARTLSPREAEVASAVAAGMSNKAIAVALWISVRTVENHLRSIFDKLGVDSRTQLAAVLHDNLPVTRQ